MFRKQELKNYLEEISQDARLLKFLFTSEEKFVIEMRCRVEDNMSLEYYSKYLSEWVLKFSKFTSTTWIVRQSYPKLQRLLFRKKYICARSSFNKKPGTNSRTRNQDCQAKIDFRFKKINRNTMKNDPLLREKLNLCIRIDFIHSHRVTGLEAYKYLKSAAETDDIFYDYIKNGYSPMAATSYHKLYLFSKYGEKSEKIANRAVNPSLMHAFYLFSKAKKEEKKVLSFEEIMESKKRHIEENGGLIYYQSENTIVIITPAMKRALTALNLNIVLITSTVLSQYSVVTLCFVPSKIGAVCFACILHKEQTEAAYSQAFFAIKLMLENFKTFEPKIISVDNLPDKKSALESIYSGSRVMISPWSMCNQIWCWLCDEENKIDRRRRHDLMVVFHEMLYAADYDIAQKYYYKLKEDAYVSSSSNLEEFLNSVWRLHHQFWWPGEQNHLIELSITTFNEFLKSKCKSFNLISMVDVVVNIVDSHICQIMWSCIKNKDIVKIYTKFLDKTEGVLGGDIKNVGRNEYKIDRKGEPSKVKIRFRTDTLCCECAFGMKGHFCVHLCALMNTSNIDLKIPHISENEKTTFLEIAGDRTDKFGHDDQTDERMDEENTQAENLKDPGLNDIVHDQLEISPKREVDDDDYYYLEVKKEIIDKHDPLEEVSDNEEPLEVGTSFTQSMDTNDRSNNFKEQYAKAIKSVNAEFRRLNKYFKENANASNLTTMVRLARELGKIRPVERVNLNNMVIELNNAKDLQGSE